MSERPLSLGIASRRVLADVVTDDLREAIVSHELELGRRLAEDDLAAQMGVSRGPVREALMRLEREGLVHIERHKGARIASWNKHDLEEIFSLRSVLEELAIEWACKNATSADLAALEEILNYYRKLSHKQRTPKEVSKIDLDFHTGLFRAAHHDRLFRAWEILRSQIHAFLVYSWSQNERVNENYMRKWESDHERILEVVKSRKLVAARKEINEHVARGFERVSKHFAEAPIVPATNPKKKR
jgi:DNA-binding GntR family transcriptional regulator